MEANIVNKKEVIRRIAKASGITEAQAKIALLTLMGTVKGAYQKNERVVISGFGTFFPRVRKARMAWNMNTNSQGTIPERKVMIFKASPKLYSKDDPKDD